jgi:DNA invertase Pin-like site-specific DNA recombinase
MSESAPNRPAVLYAAKSTPDEKGSIPTQLEQGRGKATTEGLHVAVEHSEDSRSAYTGNRGAALAQAKADCERLAREYGECTLIVQHSDRLARGDGKQAAHVVEWALWAFQNNVKIVALQDPDTFRDLISAVVAGDRNNKDSARKSQSVKDGQQRRRERGLPQGGPRRYGTKWQDGKLVPLQHEAEIVKRMFAETLAGRSQLKIASALQIENVPTANGGTWHQGTVRGILKNRVYVELGIIDAATWAKAEALRDSRRKTHKTGRTPAGNHLFRKGMLRCECGSAMVPRTDPNRKGPPRETYFCYGRKQDPDSCSMVPVSRISVDASVGAYFMTLCLDVEATRDRLAVAHDRKLAEARALCEQAERVAVRAREATERIERDYASGELSAESYEHLIVKFGGEREGAEAEVARLRVQEERILEVRQLISAPNEVFDVLDRVSRAVAGDVTEAPTLEATRAQLALYFDRFILHRETDTEVIAGRIRQRQQDDGGPWERPIYTNEHGLTLEVWTRPEMIAGTDPRSSLLGVRKAPLALAADNYANAFTR